MSKNLSFRILAVIVLAGIGIFLFYRYANNTTKAKNFIERIREGNKAGFDSLQNAINYENDLNYRIQKSINNGDFKTAYALMHLLVFPLKVYTCTGPSAAVVACSCGRFAAGQSPTTSREV
jgi:hypothetical protein